MAIQTAAGDSFTVHVIYATGPTPEAGPIVISVSNPDVAVAAEDPVHPGDASFASITPQTRGSYVVSAFDGVVRGSLEEMQAVGSGEVPPISAQEILLAS